MTTTSKPEKEHGDDTIPFFPDHALTEYWVAFGFMLALLVIGIVGMSFPVGLEEPADPLNTPAHTKPEWYFLGLYQLLKFVPKTVGVLIPIVGIILVILLPFFDGKPDKAPKRARTIRMIAAAVFVIGYAILTIWGGTT